MRTGRRIYTAETPAPLLPESLTIKPIVQAPSKKARGNHGSKKKKKCVTGLWDLNIPSELLQEILSRLGTKANIKASVVCKTWFEAAVSVRMFQPLSWVFYPSSQDDGDYILLDPSRSLTYKHNCPELKSHDLISYSRDGWLLVVKDKKSGFFLNSFTRERISLPNRSSFLSGNCLAFSAAPTSTSCLVTSFTHKKNSRHFVIATRRPGETVWTIHRYPNTSSSGRWNKCVFSNGLFYALSNCGFLGVFDPSEATWDVLPVKPWGCAAFCQIDFSSRVLLMEHDGKIFVIFSRGHNNNKLRSVCKLNRERMVWEEKSEVCGLTVFASYPVSLTGSCSYPSTNKLLMVYYSLVEDKSSRPPTSTSLSNRFAWVEPPSQQR